MNLILLLILNTSLCVSGLQAISAEEIWNKSLLKGKQVVETVQNSRKAQTAVGLVLIVIVLRTLLKKDKHAVPSADKPSRNFLNYDDETGYYSEKPRNYLFGDDGKPVAGSISLDSDKASQGSELSGTSTLLSGDDLDEVERLTGTSDIALRTKDFHEPAQTRGPDSSDQTTAAGISPGLNYPYPD